MMTAARWIARTVWKAAPYHVLAFSAVAFFSAIIPIAMAWLTKSALDRLVSPGTVGVIGGLAAGLAVAGTMNATIPQIGQYLRAELDRRIGLQAKDELFAALEQFHGLARFEDPDFADRLRLAQQSADSPGELVNQTVQVCQLLVTLLGFTGALASIDPWFTGIVLLAAVPALVIELRLSRRRAAMLWRIGPAERRELFYGEILSDVAAAKEIRLFGMGSFLRARMGEEIRSAQAARRKMDRRELVRQGVLSLFSAMLSGGGLIWILISARNGRLTVGDVSMFVASVAGVQGALSGLVGAIASSHQQLLLSTHYAEILGAGPDLHVADEPRHIGPLRRGIEFRDVWFRYSDEHPWTLRGLNLFIPAGQAVAIVGLNGSGKSTLVKLICRFYDCTGGEIFWDGVDIRDVPVPELRKRIGAVFQDFMSYEFNAAENIGMGDPAVLPDRRRIESAARQAGVHDMIAGLPNGYDTLLTRIFFDDSDRRDPQTGVVLSGGQWQRLALARAFLRGDRDLMILDEPSSGLDAIAEHDVHLRLSRMRRGRTSLLISHRLGTVRDASLIAVISDGRVVEQGGHADLLQAEGVYARLFTLQATDYAADVKGEPTSVAERSP